jgi:O-antigen ligase
MKIFIATLIFIELFLSLLLPPAPLGITPAVTLLALLPLLIAFLCCKDGVSFDSDNKTLFLILILYILSIIFSGLIAIFSGIKWTEVFRSIMPYLAFIPLCLISFSKYRLSLVKMVFFSLIAVGLFQVFLHIYLYFKFLPHPPTVLDVLVHRITLINPRATVPLIFAATILPMYYFLGSDKGIAKQIIAALITIIGVIASLITLTRAMLLAEFLGFVIYYIFWCIYQIQHSVNNVYKKISLNTLKMLAILVLSVFTISKLPGISEAFQAFTSRAQVSTSPAVPESSLPTLVSAATTSQPNEIKYSAFEMKLDAYSDARLINEWIPAVKTWQSSSLINYIFGIGEGKAFITSAGVDRTYIHNVVIYKLVYDGIFGLIVTLCLYIFIFKRLIQNTLVSGDLIYLAYACLLLSLFVYALLFAVHKLFSYNIMLFLIFGVALAMARPANATKKR